MSEESSLQGDKSSVGGTAVRASLSDAQLSACADVVQAAWRAQDKYIEHLESLNKHLEGVLERTKETEDRIKQQYGESQHRERVLVRRLASKEQEIQDYMSQITELKSSQASLNGRPTLLDPAVNLLILRLKQELASTRARLEETQNELSAWKFTPDSNTGKKLMAKCRLLHQENEDLGRMTSSGRIAKLEGDLALQKSFSEEVKKSQSELDEFLQELDEDVEGMQSTVLFLQQELRAARDQRPSGPLPSEVTPKEQNQVNGTTLDVRDIKLECEEDNKRAYASETESEHSGEENQPVPVANSKKRRRASVLSLDYNEEDDPLTVTNGDVQ